MNRRGNRLRLFGALALVTALVLLAAPSLRLDRFREPIRRELERALSRDVEINGPVHLRILPSPGLSLTSVVIHDDPEFSREPVAYVSELGAGVSPLALVRGHIRFDSLRLIRPSVNLVKLPGGGWNYPGLLEKAFLSSETALPRIEVRHGRLNFRLSDVKSVFYLSDADVDIAPETKPAPAVRFRFSGSPSRTDRAAQGFGKLSGNGRYIYSDSEDDRLRFVVRLERSSIPEILTLLQGHGAGLGGFVASRAEFEGPLANLRFSGSLELAGIDQRFLIPSRSGEWALEYGGRLDLVRQQFELDTLSGQRSLPLAVRVRLTDYLGGARWAVSLSANELSVSTVPALAREMGLAFPAGVEIDGLMSGALSISRHDGMKGGFRLRDFRLRTGEDDELASESVAVTVGAGVWEVAPAPVTLPPRLAASVGLMWNRRTGELELQIESERLPVAGSLALWRRLTEFPAPPVLEIWEGGHWAGRLLYRRTSEGTQGWSGRASIRNAEARIDGISAPIRVRQAASDAGGRNLKLEGALEGQKFSAVVSRGSKTELELKLPAVNARELERQFAPALSWRQGFLARTLRLAPSHVPQWLRDRRVEGTFVIASLAASPVELQDLDGSFSWHGPQVEISLQDSSAGDGRLAGRLVADLLSGQPRYTADATLENYRWQSGTLDAAARLSTTGTGVSLLTAAGARGVFSLRFPGRGPHGDFDRADGCFELTMKPRFLAEVPCLEIRSGKTTFAGSGRLVSADRIDLHLYQDGSLHPVSGRLFPFRIDLGAQPRVTLK